MVWLRASYPFSATISGAGVNTFGTHFRVTTFGESHGPALGCVIDGCPAGVSIDLELLQRSMNRRRPGQPGTSPRNEPDQPEILSGHFEGITTGSPIAILVRNKDQRSRDYSSLKDLYRPSHADYTYASKYGHRDHRGGGRSSARETLARVAAGAFARMYLTSLYPELKVLACVSSMGPVVFAGEIEELSEESIYSSPLRMPDRETARGMEELLEKVRHDGDSIGGVVSVVVPTPPSGLGEPIYGKLNSLLAGGMMSINGATGFEMGDGFQASRRRGSEHNDQWTDHEGELRTVTNRAGGVSGGISNGMPLRFSVAFKPPSSISKVQRHGTVDGTTKNHAIDGRHDPSIVVRAVSVVESMTWLILADRVLAARTSGQI